MRWPAGSVSAFRNRRFRFVTRIGRGGELAGGAGNEKNPTATSGELRHSNRVKMTYTTKIGG